MPLCSTARRYALALLILGFTCLPAVAIDEPLRALRGSKLSVETGPQPEIDLEAPPSAYPLKPVEQIAFRGARHGLVNTTTGTMAFQTLDLRLPVANADRDDACVRHRDLAFHAAAASAATE